MNLFRRKPTPPAHLPLRINHGLTLEIWRQRPDYVKWAKEFFRSQMGSELVSVLRNSQPFSVARGLTDTEAAIELGRVRGYMEAINVLAATATEATRLPVDVPVDYNVDEALKAQGLEEMAATED